VDYGQGDSQEDNYVSAFTVTRVCLSLTVG